MEWWQALVLGIVEGLTEYLPVSSTGHLLLAERAMGIPGGVAADSFAICIQAGAILAVLGLYWRRVHQMILGVLGRNPEGRNLLICLFVAFLPAVVAGLALEKPIKKYLFGGEAWGLWPTVAAWIIGGIAILAVPKFRREADSSGTSLASITWKMALVIGLWQCVAMWPGTSRSLVTILGGLLVGMRLSAAVEFSFLLGVVTLSAATAKDGLQYGDEMAREFGAPMILLGMVAAWISAVFAVKWMVAYLNRHGLGVFGYYRIALGIVVAGLILSGWFAGGH